MRLSKYFLAVIFGVILGSQPIVVSAQERSCAGSCDEYGEPVYNVDPDFHDHVRVPSYDDSYLDEEFRNPHITTPPPLPRYVHRQHRETRRSHSVYQPRYRKQRRSLRRHRNVQRYYEREYIRPDYRDIYAGRTEFCRTHVERRGKGWRRHKVNVRRCVWVRNDLLPHYAGQGQLTDRW